MIKAFPALIIMGLSCIVNATEHKSLRTLIREAEARGESWNANDDDAAYAGVPIGTPGKALEVDASLSEDNATHDFIVFERDGQAIGVLFDVIREGARQVEHLNLVCSAEGKLNRCYRQTGQKDEAGNPIRGSAETKPVNPTDKKMNALLHHELDFWLRGKYRKIAKNAGAKP